MLSKETIIKLKQCLNSFAGVIIDGDKYVPLESVMDLVDEMSKENK
jgi:hypothetical protein